MELQMGDKLKELFGMVEGVGKATREAVSNVVEQAPRYLDPLSRLPEKDKETLLNLGMDLLPGGAAVGMIKKVKSPSTVKPAAKELLPDRYMRLFNKEKVSSTLQDVLDPKSRSTIVYMTPDDFLKVAYPREKTYASLTQAQRMALGEEKRAPIRKAIKEGGLNDIPKLFTDAGQVTGHEGRHRMDVFKELGYERIPVEVRDTMYRWGENPPPYKELISETGEATVGMPKSVVWDKAE